MTKLNRGQATELRGIANGVKRLSERLRVVHNEIGLPSETVEALENLRKAEANVLSLIV